MKLSASVQDYDGENKYFANLRFGIGPLRALPREKALRAAYAAPRGCNGSSGLLSTSTHCYGQLAFGAEKLPHAWSKEYPGVTIFELCSPFTSHEPGSETM